MGSYGQMINKHCSKSASFLLKSVLDLILLMLQIDHIDFCHVDYLLKTESFFNLANYTSECIQIANELFRHIFQKTEELEDFDGVVEKFVERVKNFKKLVDKMQPVVFEQSVCIPIEKNAAILQRPYDKYLIRFHEHLLHLDVYPKENTPEWSRLAKVVDKLGTEEGFEAYQAENGPWMFQPAAFYLSFFKNLSVSFKTKPALVNHLARGICSILERIKQRNQFFDMFLNPINGILIGTRILTEFTIGLTFTKRVEFGEVVEKLIELWTFIKVCTEIILFWEEIQGEFWLSQFLKLR